jgi:hypothetical protein
MCLYAYYREEDDWVTSEQDVLDIAIVRPNLLMLLNNAKQLSTELIFSSPELFPRGKIQQCIQKLTEELHNISNKFRKTVLERSKHNQMALPSVHFPADCLYLPTDKINELTCDIKDPSLILEWTLQNTIESMISMYSTSSSNTLPVMNEDEQTSMKYKLFQYSLNGYRKALSVKNYDKILMQPQKKILLSKLVFLKQLMGKDAIITRSE